MKSRHSVLLLAALLLAPAACNTRVRGERMDAGLPVLDIAIQSPNMRAIDKSQNYQIQLTNRGRSAANGVILWSTIPYGNEFVSASNGGLKQGETISWALGTVPAGEVITLVLSLRQTSRRSVVYNSQSSRVWTEQSPVELDTSAMERHDADAGHGEHDGAGHDGHDGDEGHGEHEGHDGDGR